jgi:uncharacterized protein with HEPN domain
MIRADDRDLSLLHDMVSSARLVGEFTADTNRTAFADDRMTVSAVEWQMIVMGRAAGAVSGTTRARLPELGWTAMAGFADRLVRRYRDVKPDEVWTAASESASTVVRVLDPALLPE